jgi:hypothetical protein
MPCYQLVLSYSVESRQNFVKLAAHDFCRLWPAMVPNPLVTTAIAQPRQRSCVMAADLRQGRLAYLWDHAAGGRPLLPATALFEAASAVGRSLHGMTHSFIR